MRASRARAAALAACLAAAGGAIAAAPRAEAAGFWNTAATPAAAGQAGSATGGDCDPEVQRRQTAMQQAVVAGQAALARGVYSKLETGAFSDLSCLSGLLDGGLNVIFEPPSINALISMLQRAACGAAQNLVDEATGSLMQAMGGAAGGLNLGEVVPGLNLGSVAGGLRISRSSQGGGGVLNVRGLFTSQGGASAPTNLGNGLFGN